MNPSYRLTGRIEAGDLAELYKASQESGGEVVVKLFHPKTSDPAYARALAETTRVLNPLHHAGIVHTVDIGFVKKRLAVVREHVEGYTLGTVLQRLNTKEVILPSAIALYLVIQLLEVVQKAHEAGVIHGAVTPGNLMLSREGAPGLCDFGALRALMAVPELKRGFATRGRSAYRAPEVSRGEDPTELSDIYSLGAIAYELLTLREAIVANGGLSTRSGSLPPPSRLDRRIHSRLDPILLRALDPIPHRRFRSAADFAMGLRNFLGVHGGMPGQEDLRRFVRDLVPNEVNLSTLGPVPFSEPFRLTPVSGADIAHLRAEPLEASVVARTPFSRSLSQEEAVAETTEAAPVFEEYKPEAWGAQEDTQLTAPQAEPALEDTPLTAPQAEPSFEPTRLNPPRAEPVLEDTPLNPPRPEPSLEPTRLNPPRPELPPSLEPTRVGQQAPVAAHEDTDPSQSGPLEQEWEAPPGAVPGRPRKQLAPQGGVSGAREGTRVGRNSRLKWVEDFSEEKTRVADELEDAPPPQPAKGATAVRAQASRDRPEIPMPPPTADSNPVASGERRMYTEERNLLALQRRRRKALSLAGAFAVVGLFAFTLAVWQFGPPSQPSEPITDPRASALSGAVEQYGNPPRPSDPKPLTPESVARAQEEEFRPDANSAFLSIRTNLPARVYVDGDLVRRRTPLMKYPVKPGNRMIVLEALVTKERAEFPMRFEKGQHRTIDQKFESIPRR